MSGIKLAAQRETPSAVLPVPEAKWPLLPLRHVVRLNPEALAEDTRPDFKFLYIDISSVAGGIVRNAEPHRFGTAPSRARRIVRNGDVVVSTVRTYLRAVAGIGAEHDGQVASTGFAVLRPRGDSIDPRFVRYWCLSEQFVSAVIAHSTGVSYPAINSTDLVRLPISVPPADIQDQICRYLDHAELRIARAIGAKSKLTELLREQKAAVCEAAVLGRFTGSKFRETGLPWAPRVPDQWDLAPVRSALSPRREIVGNRHAEHTLLSLTLQGVIVRDLTTSKGKFPASFESYQQVHSGDFVLCLFDVDETPRTVGRSRHDGMITGAYDVFAAKNPDYAPYLEQFLLSVDRQKKLKPLYRGLRKTVPRSAFLSMPVPVPPADERDEIVRRVTDESMKIDAAIEAVRGEIALLKEYRVKLISDVVTGKLDVSKEAAGLPDIDPEELAHVLSGTSSDTMDDEEGDGDGDD